MYTELFTLVGHVINADADYLARSLEAY